MANGPGRPRFTGKVHDVERWLQPTADWIQSLNGIVTVTAAYTVPNNIFYVRANVSGGGFTVTLPPAVLRDGRQLCIMKVDSSGNTLTLGVSGSDTINGGASVTTTTQYDFWVVISNGISSWEIIASPIASTSVDATTITIVDAGGDTTTFPLLAPSATGALGPVTDPGLTYNATTNALTAATFIGALTGNADTATTVTTNANLTGPVTSVGNATSITQTGTGTTFVMNTSPTLVTPVLGVASATSIAVPTLTTASGAMTVTPAAGSNFNLALSTTGDFAVNTNQLYVDTSTGFVGIGVVPNAANLDILGGDTAIVRVQNTNAGTGNFAQIKIANENGGTVLYLYALSNSWTTSGGDVQSGSSVVTTGAGGLSIGAADAAGILRFYTGGFASGNKRMEISAAGVVTFGGNTYPSVTGTNDQVLTTNGSGTLSWTDKAGGGGGGITSLEGQTGATQTFTDDTNVTIVSGSNAHVITWAGTLAVARGGTGSATQNWVDLTTNQASIAGNKTWTGIQTLPNFTFNSTDTVDPNKSTRYGRLNTSLTSWSPTYVSGTVGQSMRNTRIVGTTLSGGTAAQRWALQMYGDYIHIEPADGMAGTHVILHQTDGKIPSTVTGPSDSNVVGYGLASGGTITAGYTYLITTVGTTDWVTQFGATSNGLIEFVATTGGTITGTGVCNKMFSSQTISGSAPADANYMEMGGTAGFVQTDSAGQYLEAGSFTVMDKGSGSGVAAGLTGTVINVSKDAESNLYNSVGLSVASIGTQQTTYAPKVAVRVASGWQYGIDFIDASFNKVAIRLPTGTTASCGLLAGEDTNFYRSAANTWRTDDSLIIGTNLTVSGTITGLTDTTEWSTDTPTITAGSGTFTSASGTTRYNQVGKRVFFSTKITITTNGTAAVSVKATLPVANKTTIKQMAVGREDAITGTMIQAVINNNVMTCYTYLNTYPGQNGAIIQVSGVYEAA